MGKRSFPRRKGATQGFCGQCKLYFIIPVNLGVFFGDLGICGGCGAAAACRAAVGGETRGKRLGLFAVGGKGWAPFVKRADGPGVETRGVFLAGFRNGPHNPPGEMEFENE